MFKINVERLDRTLLAWLSIGLFFQLSGILFNNDGSRYATQLYLLFFIPALLLILKDRMVFFQFRQLPVCVFLALAVWVLLVAGLHSGSEKTFGHWVKVVGLLGLYLYAVARLVSQPQGFSKILIVTAVVAAIFAWLSLYYQFGVLDRSLDYAVLRRQRIEAMGWNGFADLQHPIIAGLYYGVFVILLTWLFLHFRMGVGQTLVLALAVLGLVVYVLFTFSRGAWFALGGAGAALLLLAANRKAYWLLGLGLILSLAMIYLFWPELQLERARGVTGREFIWRAWFERLGAFWLWGSGAGAAFHFTFPEGSLLAGQDFFHSHSLYLQLWYQYGIVGVSLFLAFVLSLLWKGWQCREQPMARLGLALLIFALIAMVSDIYAIFHRPSPYWVVFWLPVGILLGVQKRRQADFG
ncbi:O-antigen ligase family protein [Pseudomonas alcaligenes]|uniref:O-antigen ligase family protein n=1 Tax=Pseudomonadaceae TaxID=135621 RepID=UPI001475D0DF|nr:O-antigen ligase family protein [Pseudomonas alcaligenes]MEE1949582.1 O-antigen ligase family protein [Pseudomonas alcaligenes]NMY40023.1 O-antigen ligase family protein [Pseudomonas sp. WS 5013]